MCRPLFLRHCEERGDEAIRASEYNLNKCLRRSHYIHGYTCGPWFASLRSQ